jgi:hypothetical protein
MRPSTHRLNAQLAEFNPNTHFLRSCSADRSGATAVRLPSDLPPSVLYNCFILSLVRLLIC